MTASCPGDVRAGTGGRSSTRFASQNFFFSFGHTSGRWKPGRTLMGSGLEEDQRRNAAMPEQSKCNRGKACRGVQAGGAGLGRGGERG